jgi:hypothetical protein
MIRDLLVRVRGAIADERVFSIVVPRGKLHKIAWLATKANQLHPHLRKNAPVPIKKRAAL